jgi:hypothetical protein
VGHSLALRKVSFTKVSTSAREKFCEFVRELDLSVVILLSLRVAARIKKRE